MPLMEEKGVKKKGAATGGEIKQRKSFKLKNWDVSIATPIFFWPRVKGYKERRLGVREMNGLQ